MTTEPMVSLTPEQSEAAVHSPAEQVLDLNAPGWVLIADTWRWTGAGAPPMTSRARPKPRCSARLGPFDCWQTGEHDEHRTLSGRLSWRDGDTKATSRATTTRSEA